MIILASTRSLIAPGGAILALMKFSEDMVKSGDLSLFVSHNDKKGKETILFVHGVPDSHDTWAEIMPHFADSYQVAALDLRGFGTSDKPARHEDYYFEEVFADLAGVIAFLQPKDGKVHLVGHDMGSLVCWGFISDPSYRQLVHSYHSSSGVHPRRVRELLTDLLSGSTKSITQALSSFYIWLFQVPAAPELFMSQVGLWYPLLLEGADIPAGDSMRKVTHDEVRQGAVNAINLYRHLVQSPIIDYPQSCELPIHVIVNDNDPGVRASTQQAVPEGFTNVTFSHMQTNHWGHREQPERFAELMRSFLNDLPTAGESSRNIRDDRYVFYGYDLSYFSGKARAYLKHKGVNFVEKQPSACTVLVKTLSHNEDRSMPSMRRHDGMWLQDTKHIIDTLENDYPEGSVIPFTPVQRFAAYLFEFWADETWLPVALHTRWNFEENYAPWEKQLGSGLLPLAPGFVQDIAASIPASMMQEACYKLGAESEQIPLLERWTDEMLDALEEHFAIHHYILGGRPSLADFGLYGPLYGHLSRDPWPKKNLIEPRANLTGWIERMTNPPGAVGEYLAEDQIPETLSPILKEIAKGFVPFLGEVVDDVEKQYGHYPRGQKMPRLTGQLSMPMAEGNFMRAGMSIYLWMAQRLFNAYGAMSEAEQNSVREWLASIDAEGLLDLRVRPVRRIGLSAAFA